MVQDVDNTYVKLQNINNYTLYTDSTKQQNL